VTAAAPISEYVLRASGGNPAMAYGLYAGGHLGPAFSLLTIVTGRFPGRLKGVTADPVSYFHPAPDRQQRQSS
jgi:hypothetical protein